MTTFNFSLGRNTYDNSPTQLAALDFDDFIAQISKTGSKRKGGFYICSSLQSGVHDDPVKYPGLNNWRLKRLALPRLPSTRGWGFYFLKMRNSAYLN